MQPIDNVIPSEFAWSKTARAVSGRDEWFNWQGASSAWRNLMLNLVKGVVAILALQMVAASAGTAMTI